MTSDLVSSTIVARSREPEGLRTMMVASSIAHVVGIAALVIVPWILGTQAGNVMEISFASAPGLTSVSKAVEQVEPSVESPKPVQARPPVPTKREMVEPTPSRPTASTPTTRRPSTSKPALPTIDEQVRSGSSGVETGSPSNESGLSTRGGTGSPTTNVDFCDAAYLGQMVSIIYRNWNRQQPVTGSPIIRFVIQRDGTLTDIALRQPSGYAGLDIAAIRAVTLTRAIPPLPACYPHSTFAMNLTFEYIR